ncbi:DDE-type integrase/transposase/recombinase [Streptomyces sp. cg2]|uniref:DDE-type integrase/transposase/recombinase n=1 Tax=Streptomyces sp. cg2 TaxID=3238799 RepID=UPI0034E1C2FB
MEGEVRRCWFRGLARGIASAPDEPTKLPADVEALVCEMRRSHPRWGTRRIAYEIERAGTEQAQSRATTHRVLTRNGLVRPQEQHHGRKYKRWQRETPMHLWQLDLVGGIYLADGRERKMLTGIDDYSRFIVVAEVFSVPSGRAVADAFVRAMRIRAVPAEVLTDNGKQFTGRYTRPRPGEVLFERACRENGIGAKLTGRVRHCAPRQRPGQHYPLPSSAFAAVPSGRACEPASGSMRTPSTSL